MEAVPILNFYPQDSWHDDALFAGESSAFAALAELSRKAMKAGFAEAGEVFSSPEGRLFSAAALRVSEIELAKLRIPYFGNFGFGEGELFPWSAQVGEGSGGSALHIYPIGYPEDFGRPARLWIVGTENALSRLAMATAKAASRRPAVSGIFYPSDGESYELWARSLPRALAERMLEWDSKPTAECLRPWDVAEAEVAAFDEKEALDALGLPAEDRSGPGRL